MSQVLCPSCGARCSSQSTACWKCETPVDADWRIAPRAPMSRLGKTLLIIFSVIIVAAGICFIAFAVALGSAH